MIDFHRVQRVTGRIALALLAVLAGVVVWTAKPWAPDRLALRPDTGAAAGALDDAAIEAVLSELLTRVYGAFGQTEEGAIYDGLATAVASDLLTDLYLQRRAAMATEPPELEGSTEITEVALDQIDVLARDPQGYRIGAEWTVVGILGHEDHRHERVNRYAATLTLGPADGEWRLTAFDLDQVRREEVPLFFEAFQ